MESHDLVVVGAGAAGMCAAIAAAGAGGAVLLVEAADRVGGSFHLSSGQMSAAGTRLQAARGLEDSPDRHFDEVMRLGHGKADPVLVRLAVDHAADTLHWLLDHGLELLPDHPVIHLGHEPYEVARTYWGPKEGRSVLEVVQPLLEREIAAGRVALKLSSRVVRLSRQDDAWELEFEGGGQDAPRRVRARAVLLASGGYSANSALFPTWSAGKPLFGGGYAHSQGDGLLLAEAAGGRVINTDRFLPSFAGADEPSAPGGVWMITQTYPQIRPPWEIYVDAEGRRFMREDEPSVDRRERVLLELPDMTFWVVYDQAVRDAAPSLFLDLPDDALASRFGVAPGYATAPTPRDLAAAMGVDPDTLSAALEGYNSALRTGAPDPFGREHRPLAMERGPWYAVRHRGWSIVGFAGVKVDGDLRVLDGDDRPIPGLYAAGEVLGMGVLSGDAYVGGMSVTPAMTLGRLLGARLGRETRTNSAA